MSQPSGVTMLRRVCSIITSGTWDCTKTMLFSGSMPAASQSRTISWMLGRISFVDSPLHVCEGVNVHGGVDAVVLPLEGDPVLQGPQVVADVQPPGWAHT